MERGGEIPIPPPEEESDSLIEEESSPLTEIEKERRKEIRKQLVGAIHELLKPAGFKRQGSTWYREQEDIIQVVNLQRSSFSFSFMLNLGIFVKKLNPEITSPKEYDCHYQDRFETVGEEDVANRREEIDDKRKILDFEDTSATAEEKIAKLKEVVENKILPFFSDSNSTELLEKLNIER